ncbi:cellulase family glycosylhydrolase [Mucilaginibacter sp. Bleaf8]|uniref:glycoside hydrolase family 5 protein n=1 Tax=Mucilaginibacter sp. Bleaf8 TaxID=2834430 RepID=UPI001BCD9BB6|nr:cellulase family glycosylhydrolase [Mucilaginibacter sp. Bleaf8]MBS7566978.1 cellulase family glycosylhydrolase [Mucilaginibacter sp. Bleaf8]
MRFFKSYYEISARQVLLLLTVVLYTQCAKSKPIVADDKATVFNRAASLDNGISISWLEQTWNLHALSAHKVTAADLLLLKKLGFKSIRLPVAFAVYNARPAQFKQALQRVDEVLALCKKYGFKLVIDYHGGSLNDDTYIQETQKAIKIWTLLTKKYQRESAGQLFFELYNEPPHMDPQKWKDAAYNMVTAIRLIDKKRTLLVGASNFNSIYELSRFVRLADNNIIYTCHFYEPFLFTHQGAPWVGDQVATTGVPFPYTVENFPALNPKAKGTAGESNYELYKTDGNEQSVRDKLQIVKNWSAKYYVPVICGEYGVYNQYADLDSRCRYIKAVRTALKELHIPGMLWEYDGNFSIFSGKPSLSKLPDCMKQAIGYVSKKNKNK